MPEYQYTLLDGDEIRLIRLLPGNFGDKLCLNIVHEQLLPEHHPQEPGSHSLVELQQTLGHLQDKWHALQTPEGRVFFYNDTGLYIQYEHPDPNLEVEPEPGQTSAEPHYDALSYCWGPDVVSATAEIYGDDGLHTCRVLGTLQLRPGLELALRNLRYPDRSRTMWVDAICIDQNNVTERSRQVGRMGLIYSRAERVLAWLGAESDGSRRVLALLNDLGAQIEISREGDAFRSAAVRAPDWRLHATTASATDWFLPSQRLPYDAHTWGMLASFLRRPYFTRLWVMQEVRLANSNAVICCGDDHISLHAFRRSIGLLSMNTNLPDDWPQHFAQRTMQLFARGRRVPLLPLLGNSFWRGCANMRDRLYGILSLAPPNLASTIIPDYTLPIEDVYRDLFFKYTYLTHRLELLRFCGRYESALCLPTWIPDLSVTPVSSIDNDLSSQATGISRCHIEILSPDALQVLGVHCLTIEDVSEPLRGDRQDVVAFLRAQEPADLRGVYVTNELMLQAWMRFLSLDRTMERFPTGPNYARMGLLVASQLSEPNLEPFYRDVLQLVRRATLYGTSLLVTAEKYLVWGPSESRKGDQVVLFLGHHMPIVLRPQPNQAFTVVGECYVQGLMDGEGLLGKVEYHPWLTQYVHQDGHMKPRYFNTKTETPTFEDPRLGALHDWERVELDLTPDDPLLTSHFRNKRTGEMMNSDPRMLPEALEKRGIRLKEFVLN